MSEKKLFSSLTNARDVFDSLMKIIQNVSSVKDTKLRLYLNDPPYSREILCTGKEFSDKKSFEELYKGFENHKWLSPEFRLAEMGISSAMGEKCTILRIVPEENQIGYNIIIGQRDNSHSDCYILEFADAVYNYFPQITTRFDLACEKILPGEKSLLDARQTSINALQDASKNILDALAKKNEEWHEKILKYENELDQKYKTKEESLENKFSEKGNKLDADRQAFEEERKKFNDSENKLVRRDLLERIEKIIKENKTIKLSQDTEKKGHRVIIICALLCGISSTIFLYFIFLFFYYVIMKNSFEYTLLLPASTFLCIFLSTTVYLIRWHGQVFRMHADAELANKKFETDILRAGWLAEMYFEWEEKKEAEFPPQMIESFTRNLFENNTRQERVTHPLEDVIKIAGKFDKFSVGKNGLEIESAKKSAN